MLVVETVVQIRREFSVKGKSIKEIVRDLGVSRNTVRKVLRSGETAFSYERSVQPLPKLGPWASDLDRLLETNERKARRERLTPVRVFEDLQGGWAIAAAMMPCGDMRGAGSVTVCASASSRRGCGSRALPSSTPGWRIAASPMPGARRIPSAGTERSGRCSRRPSGPR